MKEARPLLPLSSLFFSFSGGKLQIGTEGEKSCIAAGKKRMQWRSEGCWGCAAEHNSKVSSLSPPSFPSPLAETGKKLQWQLGWDGGVSKSWSCCWLGTRVRWVCRQLAGRGQSLSHIRHLCPPMPPPTTIGEGHSAAGWTGKTEKIDGYFRHCNLSEFAADKKGNE